MKQNKLYFADALAREDRRVDRRKMDLAVARRRLLPYLVAVCEVYRVSAEDLLCSWNRHVEVVRARDVIAFLAFEKCRLSSGVVAALLQKDRADTSKRITRVRHRAVDDAEFAGEIARVLGAVRK